jgi:heat shock protein HtpX
MGGFLALLGWLLWDGSGVLMLLITGVIFVFLNPTLSPRLIMRLYGARFLTPAQAPDYYAILRELAHRAGLAVVPTLYYVPSRMVNAFTVGRKDRFAVAVTDGLLRALDTREQIGVLAHEVSHVRSNDMWVMGLADTFSRLMELKRPSAADRISIPPSRMAPFDVLCDHNIRYGPRWHISGLWD